jgi:glycerophosphoryl diester phosphodiesterase
MNETPHLTLRRLARRVAMDLWSVRWPLVVFEVVFKGLAFLLGAAGTACVISPLIASSGRSAVANADIARFLITPAGILTFFMLAFCFVLGTMLEHVGVIAIAACHLGGRQATVAETFSSIKAVLVRLASFGVAKLSMLALLCAPFVVLAGLSYVALLSGHDINYYLTDRPPSWYVALLFAGVLATALASIIVTLYVSTLFAVPILLFEDCGVREAVRESRARTIGARWRIGVLVVGWQLVSTLIGVAVIWAFGRAGAFALAAAGERPRVLVPLVALLLVCHALILAALSFAAVSIQCLLILRLYLDRGGRLESGSPSGVPRFVAGLDPLIRRMIRWRLTAVALAAVVVACLGFSIAGRLRADEPIVVVAHRGYSRWVPENSLSAFQRAIEAGADMIELDVQETADGQIVVVHDRDLMRLARDKRAIADITLAQARQLDIGRRIGLSASIERIPTLVEAIAITRGRVKLQIELKYYAQDKGLAAKVAELVRREQLEDECEVSSLDHEALLIAKRANPRLQVVALVYVALGDPGRLDVDGLSVDTKVLSDRLIRKVRAQNKRLYAWTVDDPREMVRLIERGVGRLVTNRPEDLVRIRRERAQMTDLERRVLAARYLLGFESE